MRAATLALKSPISPFSPSDMENGRKKVGVALGGGVIRGFAHIGALSALINAHIPIDYVAGASVGAIIGSLYSAGMKLPDIVQEADDFNWWKAASPALSTKGFVSFKGLEKWLTNILGDLHFEDLALPFAVVATDMHTGEEVVLKKGPLAPAVRASCSVPGFVTPVEIDGRILGDGGVSNNVPVSVVRNMGADYTIGVDIFSHLYERSLGPLAGGLAALEILVRRSGGGVKNADCLISPDLSGQTYLRASRRETLIALGREAAYEKVPSIKQALAQN